MLMPALKPPSQAIAWPLTKLQSVEARKWIIAAISSGSAMRPSGTLNAMLEDQFAGA